MTESALKKLILILFFTFLIRLPSLFEPFWYGDEGIYFAVADLINHGASLYTGAFDNKPPLIYLLTAFGSKFIDHSLWSARVILMIWVLITTVVIFFLSRKLFNNERVAFASSLIFALLTGIPLFEGFIANGELFMILPTNLAFLLGLKRQFVLSGLFFSLGVLFKFPSLFDFAVFVIFFSLIAKETIFLKLKDLILLCLGFALPILLTALYFFLRGHFNDFFFATLQSNIGYTNDANQLLIPNGLLLLKAVPLAALTFLFWKNRKNDKNHRFYFLILWFFFTLYGALFGGRNYDHYLIQVVPPLSILLSLVFLDKVWRKWSLAVTAAFVVIIASFGFRASYFKPSYYQNFFNYLRGQISTNEFSRSFDRKAPRNYEIASYLKERTSKNDYIFVWANEPQIYFLSERISPVRFVAAYHIEWFAGYQETLGQIIKNKPKYILLEKPPPYPFPELDKLLISTYNQVGQVDDVEIYQINNPTLRQI